ncbi:preprotein translocase subunit SecA [Candidatus Roizmanbacteria bacterium CG_4_8_14_3_um_filter_36_10]|uniref:Protein translocase subunit SecA n=4 Tax=Candidatus Roizmaniibacteriota TaxID=1752723 RepID=A0A2M7BX78_9BACT|nr:MAG: preprotein translocase subunit SecA [Candidatus Roizmanbacteria bacterium CG11_big_fil_rev_8_21_14_0_20_35_14]PIV11130.1 MAG: preprotein translocase subunit SecA [Candidatus Roizmanbacteria bacterium CG03_land_8_20_14_0_80_35_26]PJC33544.1 MAG: preprotein translocase subunit SecA [Candidatus Roizmanbacteria bacterium CG_4_9_14_0_2_um_filter_36_12]PJC81801.1 MAG: preprotein translocase subunit SecA [Candidatus Roizmanbacteria bacterium CG_4_8_14_3_um_filter_36_10]
MFNFLTKFFDYNQREISRLSKEVEEINKLEDKARVLKDNDFSKETNKLKEIVDGDSNKLNEILPWVFALAREAARRILGQRHFDVQLMAGIALHEGKIAEQKTGEGKTLSAVPALYLNTLTGYGTHLVTVNDYLARRDAGWMGMVFNFLGLKTASMISDKSFIFDPKYEDRDVGDWRLKHLRPIARKEAYEADINYGINSEFGFDYLRDNMAQNPNDLVQRDFNFAIIDEADSVLIDEARTPHIISAPYEEDTSKYYRYAQIVNQINSKSDYIIDEKLRTANLTETGIKKIESLIGVSNIYEKDFDTLFHIEAALKANTLFKLDKDYIVKDNEVIIVDEFTGRLLYGRRFSEGLHQAIEAKEKVSIQRESKTLATVSLQNYFRMYRKLAGMTGTASTEAEEFHKIYKADVVSIPTHLPMIRKNEPDMIYKTERAKYNAVVEEIANNYKVGRPVLVGTTSIEKNELLSSLLKKKGVPHELLNAKNHLREAAIIAKAGEKGAITVATNMAGRGVDIILGGENREETKEWQKKHDEVVRLGGLYVLGTERHESRRIDNQLRGRSGRQGDPGQSTFFVSLEDDLMRIFGGEQISKIMNFLNFPKDQPLSHSMVSKAIEQAQVKVEGFNFDIRKHLVDYDDVLNKQREIVYSLRKKILFGSENEDFYETIYQVFTEEINNLINAYLLPEAGLSAEDTKKLVQELNLILTVSDKEITPYLKEKQTEKLIDFLIDNVKQEFKIREKKLGKKLWIEVIKAIFLSTIDKYWMDHLTAIEDLREGINLRGYAQIDPLVAYKNEAYSMFEKLIGDINFEVSRRLLKVEVQGPVVEQKKQELPAVYKSASAVDPFTQKPSYAKASEGKEKLAQPVVSSHKKIGRNDPCWCGSGKKYKRCHYPN